jgi:hypothetical protein
MLTHYVGLLEWIFQTALFSLLLVVLAYARRLNHLLQTIRNDHDQFEKSLILLDAALTAATTKTDRLMQELRHTEVSLGEALGSAEAITRRIDASISQAAQLVAGIPAERPPPAPAKPVARLATPRGATELKSRAERDLARVLLDAS